MVPQTSRHIKMYLKDWEMWIRSLWIEDLLIVVWDQVGMGRGVLGETDQSLTAKSRIGVLYILRQ